MSDLGHHLVLRLADDRVIAPTREARRRVARVFAELSRTFPVLAWRVADTHVHLLLAGDASTATELVRRLRIRFTLTLRCSVPLEVQRCKPIVDQGHLQATFRYVLRQEAHHGVHADPEHEASSLSDALGLRVVCPELAPRIRAHLPRVQRAELLTHLGVSQLEPDFHPKHLADAIGAAFALVEIGQDAEGTRARRAAIAASACLPSNELADVLGLTPRSIRRQRDADAPDPRDVRAIKLQMGLRAALEPVRTGETYAPA